MRRIHRPTRVEEPKKGKKYKREKIKIDKFELRDLIGENDD